MLAYALRAPLLHTLLLIPNLPILAGADPIPVPVAAPEAAPVANAPSIPTADEVALAEPVAARQVYNYAPFSGAIYIVGANGAQLSQASAAQCPNQAPQGCGNIGVWNWCCPSGNTCAWTSSDQTVVGCCPSGSSCSGVIDRNAIQTVTVYITTTQYASLPRTTVTGNGGVFVAGGSPAATTIVAGGGAFVGQTTKTIPYNGAYCSTIYAQGPNLPTTVQGICGTVLVLNDGVRRAVDWRVWASVVGFYGVLGLGGWFGLRR